MKRSVVLCILIALLMAGCGVLEAEENALLTKESVLSQLEKWQDSSGLREYDLRFRYQKSNYDVLVTEELWSLFDAYAWESAQWDDRDDDESISVQLFDGYRVAVCPDGGIRITDDYAASGQEDTAYFSTDPEFYEKLKDHIILNRIEWTQS